MPRFAVGHISFFTNELKLEIIEASDWRQALDKHSSFVNSGWSPEGLTLDDAQRSAFDADSAIAVIEIPEEAAND